LKVEGEVIRLVTKSGERNRTIIEGGREGGRKG
jgi:hypothetical protein